MISCTHRPDLLRVSFTAPVGPKDFHEAEIVCYLRVVDSGLEINYVHHVMRTKSGAIGKYDNENIGRLPLDSILVAAIQVGVMYEVWSAISRSVRVVPAPMGTALHQIDFDAPPSPALDNTFRGA